MGKGETSDPRENAAWERKRRNQEARKEQEGKTKRTQQRDYKLT
jgi:hypothetical protein